MGKKVTVILVLNRVYNERRNDKTDTYPPNRFWHVDFWENLVMWLTQYPWNETQFHLKVSLKILLYK